MSAPESIVEPRDRDATMAADWQWVMSVLRMVEDRALTGTPLHVKRPDWLAPAADPRPLMRNGIVRMIDNVFSTAVVDEPETPDA